MVRDYSSFLPASKGSQIHSPSTLERLGWRPFFAQQTSIDEMADRPPVRVTEVHRSGLRVLGEAVDATIPPREDATVGDWLLFNAAHPAASDLLARQSLIQRRAPGTGRDVQLIGANIDTVFVVTSCNQDFNVARLERYIALAFEAQVQPVILLTKADLCEAPETFASRAAGISARVPVEVLDARGAEPARKLAPWCRAGQTVAFLGSSGVGKSTLLNALAGKHGAATAPIREDDAKGRHTTTRRQLHLLDRGCAVLDTPGMRELQLTGGGEGLRDLFSDLHALAQRCRFRDCRHDTEPGCAVQAAVEGGAVDAERMARWQKLAAEERFNSTSLAERKSRDKALGKLIRQVQKTKPK